MVLRFVVHQVRIGTVLVILALLKSLEAEVVGLLHASVSARPSPFRRKSRQLQGGRLRAMKHLRGKTVLKRTASVDDLSTAHAAFEALG